MPQPAYVVSGAVAVIVGAFLFAIFVEDSPALLVLVIGVIAATVSYLGYQADSSGGPGSSNGAGYDGHSSGGDGDGGRDGGD